MLTVELKLVGKRSTWHPVGSLLEASQAVRRYISGGNPMGEHIGASKWDGGRVRRAGRTKAFARVSYNGRVWEGATYSANAREIVVAEPTTATRPESTDERVKRFTAGEFMNNVFGFLTAGCAFYEKTAPTVAAHLDDVYRRLIDAPATVSWLELAQLLQLRDEQTWEWEHPNYAANRVYKVRHRLGMDVTGHAGF